MVKNKNKTKFETKNRITIKKKIIKKKLKKNSSKIKSNFIINKIFLEDIPLKNEKNKTKKQEGISILKLMIDKKGKRKTNINNNSDKSSLYDEIEDKENSSEKNFNEKKKADILINYSLEEYHEFNFFFLNKKFWCNYLNIDITQFESLYIKIFEIFLQKRTSIFLLSELISKLEMKIDSQKDLKITEFISTEKVIADIWFLEQFKGYYDDIFRRKKNITNYKNRYKDIIEKSCKSKWKTILSFIGFTIQLKFENIDDYLWFLWYLPKRLIIIWTAKIDVIQQDDLWWVKLLKEWYIFFF